MASSSPSLGLQVLRRLWRDARAGELRLLMLGLMLAVAAVSAVALLGDRIEKGLKRDAAALIGGDLVVSADRPADARWRERAQGLGLRQSHSASFPSMVRASDAQGGATRLVAVKAVDDAYPLRGQLQWLDERGEGQGARGPADGATSSSSASSTSSRCRSWAAHAAAMEVGMGVVVVMIPRRWVAVAVVRAPGLEPGTYGLGSRRSVR